MVCVDLLRRDEQLWSNIAIASIDGDMVDRENRFQTKLDLGPDDRIFNQTQIRFLTSEHVVDVARSGRESTLASGETHLVSFVVVLDERRLAVSAVVAYVVQQHLFEQVGGLELVIRRPPVDLV